MNSGPGCGRGPQHRPSASIRERRVDLHFKRVRSAASEGAIGGDHPSYTALVAVFAVGTIIGLIWADAGDVAGSIAGVTNIIAGAGIVLLLIALVVVTLRQRRAARRGRVEALQDTPGTAI